MRVTMAQKVMEEMTEKGHKYIGATSGTFTFRKGSNLARRLETLGLTEAEVEVRSAARAGQHANDGYQLLIFTK